MPDSPGLPKLAAPRERSVSLAPIERSGSIRGVLSPSSPSPRAPQPTEGIQEDGELLVLSGGATAKLILSKPSSGKPRLQWSLEGDIHTGIPPGMLQQWEQMPEPATTSTAPQPPEPPEPAETPDLDSEDEAIESSCFSLYDQQILEIKEARVKQRQLQKAGSYACEEHLQQIRSREGDLLRLVDKLKFSSRMAMDKTRLYHASKSCALQTQLHQLRAEKLELERTANAWAFPQDGDQSDEDVSSDTQLRARVQHAEASRRQLLAEQTMGRVVAGKTIQTLQRTASMRESQLMAMSHETELDSNQRYMAMEAKYKVQVGNLEEELRAAARAHEADKKLLDAMKTDGEAGVWEAIEQLRERELSRVEEAKAVGIAREIEMHQVVETARAQMSGSVKDLQQTAELNASRLQQELRELQIKNDEITLQFGKDRSHMEGLIKLETKKAAAAEHMIWKTRKAMSSKDPQAALLDQLLEVNKRADELVADAAKLSEAKELELMRRLTNTETEVSNAKWRVESLEKDNARLLVLIDVHKAQAEGGTGVSQEGTDFLQVLEDQRHELAQAQERITQLMGDVRRTRYEAASEGGEGALPSRIQALEATVNEVTSKNKLLKQEVAELKMELAEADGITSPHSPPAEAPTQTKPKEGAELDQLLMADFGGDHLTAARAFYKEARLLEDQVALLMHERRQLTKDYRNAKLEVEKVKKAMAKKSQKTKGKEEEVPVKEPEPVVEAPKGVLVDEEEYAEQQRKWKECVDLIAELDKGRYKGNAESGELAAAVQEIWQGKATANMRVEESLLNQAELNAQIRAAELKYETLEVELQRAARLRAEKQAEVRLATEKLRAQIEVTKDLQAQQKASAVREHNLNDKIDSQQVKIDSLQNLVETHKEQTEARLAEIVGASNSACELARNKANLNEKLLDRTSELEHLVEDLEEQLRKAHQTEGHDEQPFIRRMDATAKGTKGRKARAEWLVNPGAAPRGHHPGANKSGL